MQLESKRMWYGPQSVDLMPQKLQKDQTRAAVEALVACHEGLEHLPLPELRLQVWRTLHQLGYYQGGRHGDGPWLPMDLHFVALDETEYWYLPALAEYLGIPLEEGSPGTASYTLRGILARIETIYVYDRNQIVRMCETSPSYTLHYVETRVRIRDRWREDWDDELYSLIEKIEGWVWGKADELAISYQHCSTIDALVEQYDRRQREHAPGGTYVTNTLGELEQIPGSEVLVPDLERFRYFHLGNPGLPLDLEGTEALETRLERAMDAVIRSAIEAHHEDNFL